MAYQLRSSCQEAKSTSGIQTFDRIFGPMVGNFRESGSSKIGYRHGKSNQCIQFETITFSIMGSFNVAPENTF